MASDTSGVGTRMLEPVSLPASSGSAFATAFAAPVSVMTMFSTADRPRRSPLWKLSVRFWSLVNEWTVSTCPRTMPYASSIALSTGVMALVVQEAADRMRSSAVIVSSLMPWTMFFSGVLPGAVSSTRDAPGLSRCRARPSSSRQRPVLSTTIASWIP